MGVVCGSTLYVCGRCLVTRWVVPSAGRWWEDMGRGLCSCWCGRLLCRREECSTVDSKPPCRKRRGKAASEAAEMGAAFMRRGEFTESSAVNIMDGVYEKYALVTELVGEGKCTCASAGEATYLTSFNYHT